MMTATLRLARQPDASALAQIYAPFCEQTIVSFETIAPTPAEMGRRIETITAQYPWLVIDDGGDIAGYVYASRFRERAAYQWSVEVTAYTHPNFRRCGVGRALYTSLFALLRLQGYHKAFAGIGQPNEASVSLHMALGFEFVGVYRGVGYKLGGWHDVAWYQLTIQPERADPLPATGIHEVLARAEGQAALLQGLIHYRGRQPGGG